MQVLKSFGVRAKTISKRKLMYICETDKGKKIIRKCNLPPEKLNFINLVQEHLYEKGFTNIERFEKTIYDKPYYLNGGNIYVMTEFKDFTETDLGRPTQAKEIVEQLALMHKLSKGVDSSLEFSGPTNINSYKKSLKELHMLKKKISSGGSMSEFDVLVLKNYGYYLEKSNEALEILESSNYAGIMEKALTEKMICHNTIKEENIKLDLNNHINILNFEKCTYSHNLFDLADFIQRYIKKEPADQLNITEIIEQYNKITPLTDEELKILYGILKFPAKFHKFCREYYQKRRSWTPSATIAKFEKYLAGREVTETYINQLKMKE